MRHLVSILVLPIFASVLAAQPEEQARSNEPILGSGTDYFRALLKYEGFTPIDRLDLSDDPGAILIVLVGDPSQLTRTMERQIVTACGQGASLLVAVTRPLNDRPGSIRSLIGCSPRGEVLVGNKPEYLHRGRVGRPYLLTLEPRDWPGMRPAMQQRFLELGGKIVQGLDRIATNRPSWVEVDGDPGLFLPIARFTDDVNLQFSFGNDRFDPKRSAHMVTSMFFAGGKVLVLGGHGTLVNAMLLAEFEKEPRDCDNFTFAQNAIQWLKDRPGMEPRSVVYFVENGKVRTDFSLDLRPEDASEKPSIAALTNAVAQAMNKFIREKQEANAFNRYLLQQAEGSAGVLRRTALLFSIALVGYGLFRIFQSRQMINALAQPLAEERRSELLPSNPLTRMRAEAIYDLDNYSELARRVAQERLIALGDALPTSSGAQPEVVYSTTDAERAALQPLLARLRGLAWGKEPSAFRQKDWQRLLTDLARLEEAARAGGWRFSAERERATA